MQFVAIDFETASHRADSACQLAVVVVDNGQIIKQNDWLIKPPRMYFAPRNVEIHGIRPEHVLDQPTLQELWPQILAYLDGQVILAHNARFDISVLVSTLATFDIACPNLEFSCTRSIARRAWPNQPSYGLKPLGTWLGIDFKHHDALEDAKCCTQIALSAASVCGAQDMVDLESKLRLTRGKYALGKLTGPRMIGRHRRDHAEAGGGPGLVDRWGFPTKSRTSGNSIDRSIIIQASGSQLPLSGKKIVFLGPLRGMNQDETVEFAMGLGAVCQTVISKETHYVIASGGIDREIAQQVLQRAASEGSPGSLSVTDTYAGIRILSERQFLALLPAGKAAVRW